MGYTDRREIKQFQFTAWPDHGVPEHSAPFLQFIRRIHTLNPGDSGPIVTHCRYKFHIILFRGVVRGGAMGAKPPPGPVKSMDFSRFSDPKGYPPGKKKSKPPWKNS